MLSEQEGADLLRTARRALEAHFGLDPGPGVAGVRTPDGVGGVFATLTRSGELRGCIGYVIPNIELKATTERAAVAAATSDPRFAAVTVDELNEIRISISVLTNTVVVEDVDAIDVGRDGLVVEREGARGLLLPQVAVERRWDRERFISETCVKAGLPPDAWTDEKTVILRFSAWNFDEQSVNKRSGS